MMPSEREIRRTICEIGRRLYRFRMVAANDGNISCRLAADRIVTTPTGVCKGDMTADMLVTVDRSGRVLSTGRPSSELPMHLFIYEQRPDVRAVVHAHPIYATAFATAGIGLNECVLPEVVMTLGSIPLAQYATPGTDELPESLRPYVQRYDAILLANHGAVTFGRDLWDAYFKMERLEHYAQILFLARRLGGERPLSRQEFDRLIALRERFGLEGPGPGCEIVERPAAQQTECGCGDHAHVHDTERIIDELYREIRPYFFPQDSDLTTE